MTSSTISLGRQTLAGLRLLVVMTVLLGAVFPAAIWGVGQIAFRDQAAGSLVHQDDKVIGSSLLGQAWKGPQWFQSRPSASDYAGDTSGGSNLGPSDKALTDEVAKRRTALGGGIQAPDALTASGSGLDPHISPAYADQQVARVAKARGLQPAQVKQLVEDHTEGRTLGYLGRPRVNVLELNIALNQLGSSR
ncbi:potassium-transporting ATPase subunit KdpC [Luteipulveratus mongoliensis]|uniref:Potassium-transporting ATPase KdpC subunit n=1 Tax=Luteipulveratus mongoliensis TaxID=571913 RepID=A0A0K1JQS0_9MICO|nr:potassium-transporting ATPase subunit KdpC [Luteipulveratus mongoliensis]AKU19069.1 potassium transporter KtrA [Luteipulveratus mongoliensis]